MKEDLLKDFRNDYVKRLKKKQSNDKDLKILMERKKMLENSPIVRDYIQLNSQIEMLLNESHNMNNIFFTTLCDYEDKGLMSETNGIYVYTGTYYNEAGIFRRVYKDSPFAEFDKYVDIESMREIEIPIEDRSAFLENHKIVPVDEIELSKYSLLELRKLFIENALYDGQEVACKKILCRNKKNL